MYATSRDVVISVAVIIVPALLAILTFPSLLIAGNVDSGSAILYTLLSLLAIVFTWRVIVRYKQIFDTCGHAFMWIVLLALGLGLFLTAFTFFFTVSVSNKISSPAVSRNLNRECVLDDFDLHDLWHIIGAYGLFFLGVTFYYTNPPIRMPDGVHIDMDPDQQVAGAPEADTAAGQGNHATVTAPAEAAVEMVAPNGPAVIPSLLCHQQRRHRILSTLLSWIRMPFTSSSMLTTEPLVASLVLDLLYQSGI